MDAWENNDSFSPPALESSNSKQRLLKYKYFISHLPKAGIFYVGMQEIDEVLP